MDCDAVRAHLPALAAHATSRRRASVLTRHVAGCAACAAEWSALQQTADLLAAYPTPVPPDGLWEAVAARLSAVAAPASRRPRWALATGIVVLLGLLLWPRPPQPTAGPFVRDHYHVAGLVSPDGGAVSDVLAAAEGRR